MGWAVVPWIPRDACLEDMEHIVYGDIEPLMSQFDLSFNSVLNLYAGHRDEDIRLILKRNFAQFQANKDLPRLTAKVAEYRELIEEAMPRCTEKKDDMDRFKEFYRRKQEIIQTLHRQMDDIQHGMRGRRNRMTKNRLKEQFADKIAALDAEEATYICGRCPSKGKCTGRLYRAEKLQKKLDYWLQELETQEALQLPIFEEKLSILRRLGYVDDQGLLARGEFASRIHVEEIAVTELYFKGVFHEWDHHEINALALALTTEFRKRGVTVERREKGKAWERMREARSFIGALARRHRFVRQLDISYALLMHAWSKGQPFDELIQSTSMSEGDLIRAFRQAIDMLRQIREATDDQSLKAKMTDCIHFVNRDIVLATELRD